MYFFLEKAMLFPDLHSLFPWVEPVIINSYMQPSKDIQIYAVDFALLFFASSIGSVDHAVCGGQIRNSL